MSTHRMRLFHFYYHEVVENMGVQPEYLYPYLELCRFYVRVESDAADLAVLEEMLEEFYGITPEGWAEWQS